ncbi:MAG: STAS domain-containing protein [Mycobacterium sp.]|nr:STAS domain-containing protein [Mycobacterium sp.]
MSAIRHPKSASPDGRLDAARPTREFETPSARFTAQWGPSFVVVTAHGELDASNAHQLADYVQRCATHSRSVILNLSGLDFFGTAGFSALHTINVRCAAADVRWAVVPSRAVSRLLGICDPDSALPVTKSVPAILEENEEPRRLLQLIPQSR